MISDTASLSTPSTPSTPSSPGIAGWRALSWRLVPETARSPQLNMALDEVLTERVGAGERPPTLRIWGWSGPCVVLGRFQSVRNEVDEIAAKESGVEIVRRISGGGAMFIEPEGAITWSLYAPVSFVRGLSFAESYQFLDAWAVEALRGIGINAWYEPLNDITSTQGKIGGAAQARRGGAVLHHTTIAYDMNVPRMLNILRIGKEKLSDKGVTSAEKRVGPLLRQTSMTRGAIIAHLIEHFRQQFRLVQDELTLEEIAEAERRVTTRFSTKAWIHYLP